jgi:glycosyltransferase involved in cell wall biosynthesis
MLKFSIITAVYNRCNTIERALDSVQNQDYSNIESVVIDGNSNDGSLEIIKSKISEKDVLISEPDKGIYDALNKGIKNSTGEIVAFMHSDDFYHGNNIISQVASIFENNKVDVVYGDATFFLKNNSKNLIRSYISGDYSKKRLAWGFMPAHPSMFVRRNIYDEVGYFKTSYKIAADYEFLCRLISRKKLKLYYLKKKLVSMQIGGISTSGLRNTIILNKEVKRACLENGIYTNYLMLISKYPAKMLGFLNK